MQHFPIFMVILSIPALTNSQSGDHLCGSELTLMLELVCGGQYFGSASHSKRSSHLFSINDNKMKSPEILKAELKSINIQKRGGVVDECCVRSCTFETLQSYCLHPQSETQNSKEEQKQTDRISTTTTTTVSTTLLMIPETTTSRIRSRQRSRWFFLYALGRNPTRHPHYPY
ncbi:bombyxin F-1-like [Mytilus galloprovincialis]|uniref:bombyxin F-1-like n=1 Tax=Mytilus galloprovincialis TaxID=29158 RepID=UPI003F7C9544